jgi:hypothetical protein
MTDRLSYFGRRMSLFLQMLVLRGVCSILDLVVRPEAAHGAQSHEVRI